MIVKRPRGRPPKAKSLVKTKDLTIRLTETQYNDFKTVVNSEGLAMSKDLRAYILGRIKAYKKKHGSFKNSDD